MRRFEVSEVGPREVAQLSLVGLRALSGNDKGVRRFTPAFVWQANNRHFLHGRVPQENAFDLNGGDVFAAANDDVFQAVADLDIAIGMYDRGVSSMKPAAVQCTLSRFFVVIVAGHDHVAAGYDFALGDSIAWHLAAVGANHAQFSRRNQLDALTSFDRRSLTNRKRFVLRPMLANGDKRGCLGQAVNMCNYPAELFFQSLDGGSGGRCAGSDNSDSFRRKMTHILRCIG